MSRRFVCHGRILLVLLFIIQILIRKHEATAQIVKTGTEHGGGTEADPEKERTLMYDPNGYVLFCMCMGRFGNQMDHFLGGLAFAKALNRTLLLPPFTTYKSVPFTDWFELETLQEYHRVESANVFMKQLAPTYWPPNKRIGFCWLPPNHTPKICNMKKGNPFGPFWSSLGVDFVGDEVYSMTYYGDFISEWTKAYPPQKYPVLAFRGAPAAFPVIPQHRHLQRYLKFTKEISSHGDDLINEHFGKAKFVGLHLRNGIDWERACEHTKKGVPSFMASTQCIDRPNVVTWEICFPSTDTVLRLTKKIVKKTGAKFVFVATDKNPLINDLEKYMSTEKVKVVHMDPWLPWIDLYILGKADYFIGNCVSSFTAFAKRVRDVEGKPSTFWGIDSP